MLYNEEGLGEGVSMLGSGEITKEGKKAIEIDGKDKKLIVVTVGLADPTDNENTDHIKGEVKKQLPAGVYEQATVLHFRGAIDYTKLNFKHKTMMGLLVRKAKNLPEEKKNAEVRAMIETYNQAVDFVDFESLSSIIDELK